MILFKICIFGHIGTKKNWFFLNIRKKIITKNRTDWNWTFIIYIVVQIQKVNQRWKYCRRKIFFLISANLYSTFIIFKCSTKSLKLNLKLKLHYLCYIRKKVTVSLNLLPIRYDLWNNILYLNFWNKFNKPIFKH